MATKAQLKATEGEWSFDRAATVVAVSGQRTGPRLVDKCEMCGATLKYVHTLTHAKHLVTFVGYECAATLVKCEDFDLPRLAQAEVIRRADWRRRKYNTPGVCFVDREKLEQRGKL
jgi:hypothetical protein